MKKRISIISVFVVYGLLSGCAGWRVSEGNVYTKLDTNGADLPASATSWQCVRDRRTGLVWEAKVSFGELRDSDNKYTWYNPDSAGPVGYQHGGKCSGSDCDTYAYTQAVNAQGLCGANDWRMPTVKELHSLLKHDRNMPAIDTAYFPNTSDWFWSSSTSARNNNLAWYVDFYNGYVHTYFKDSYGRVRLVRAGQ